jgi:alpha-D-xyloside xylohydrolase
VRVYRGADGAFTLYDDAGDGYGYERGEHATMAIRWDDARGVLTFDARQGRYPGLGRERTFNVLWIDADGAQRRETVRYKGLALRVLAGGGSP